ncbi:MAG: hypothetical protein H6R18_1471 [Proteobacteria bacterium]|nr:hypothetical protein [Pseudomonadota bacterium]
MPSFRRKPESRKINALDSGFRRGDEIWRIRKFLFDRPIVSRTGQPRTRRIVSAPFDVLEQIKNLLAA